MRGVVVWRCHEHIEYSKLHQFFSNSKPTYLHSIGCAFYCEAWWELHRLMEVQWSQRCCMQGEKEPIFVFSQCHLLCNCLFMIIVVFPAKWGHGCASVVLIWPPHQIDCTGTDQAECHQTEARSCTVLYADLWQEEIDGSPRSTRDKPPNAEDRSIDARPDRTIPVACER